MWEGINGFDPEGWAKEETVLKTWDSAAASELSRRNIVRSHLPVISVRYLLSEAFRTGQFQKPQADSHPADESMSKLPSEDDERAEHNVTEVIGITDEESSADERDDVRHGPSMSHDVERSNRTISQPAASHKPEPDDPQHFRQEDLPRELVLLMEQWTIQRGTKEPLPCALNIRMRKNGSRTTRVMATFSDTLMVTKSLHESSN